MHDLIASLPVLVQLAVVPIVGSLIGFVYALLTRRAEVGLQGFGAKIGVGGLGAVLGAWVFANYLAAALVALLFVWLFGRFVLKEHSAANKSAPDNDP
jgi:phosphate/sulfate permease